jgi:hypothetical protein
MKDGRCLLFLVVIALCILPLTASVIGGGGSTRVDNPVTTFKDGMPGKIITFNGPGTDESAEIELPTGCRVTSASMDIEGQIHMFTTVVPKDHTDTNNLGWKGRIAAMPYTETLTNLQSSGTAFGAGDYTDVKTLDNSRLQLSGAGTVPYTLHKIDVGSMTNVNYLQTYAAGFFYGKDSAGMGMRVDMACFLYNSTSLGWDQIGITKDLSGNEPSSNYHAEGKVYGGFSNYVDASNWAWMLITTTYSFSDPYYHLDYCSINVSIGQTSFPTDPAIDIGGDGDDEWTHSGEFNSLTTLNDAGFVTELQQHVDAGSGATVVIPVNVSSTTVGKISLSNLDIGYYENAAPTLLSDISNLFDFPEDGSGEALINVTPNFDDDHDTVFRMETEQRGGTNIVCTLNADGHHIDFSAPPDWYGQEEFRVKVYDTGLDAVYDNADDLFAESNWFFVTVTPTDDAPTIDTRTRSSPPP